MKAFIYTICLRWKIDLRDKEIIVTYYIVPLVFFLFMGGVFNSIIPDYAVSLIPCMTIFGATMGATLGSPSPLIELYGNELKKAYKAGNIPLWTSAVCNFISAFLHLFLLGVIIFLAAPLIYKAERPENLLTYFLSYSIFLIASISLGTLLGLYVKQSSKLAMLAQIIFLPSVIISGIMVPVEMLPKPLQVVGSIFPATWAYKQMTQPALAFNYLLPMILIAGIVLLLCAFRLKKLSN